MLAAVRGHPNITGGDLIINKGGFAIFAFSSFSRTVFPLIYSFCRFLFRCLAFDGRIVFLTTESTISVLFFIFTNL